MLLAARKRSMHKAQRVKVVTPKDATCKVKGMCGHYKYTFREPFHRRTWTKNGSRSIPGAINIYSRFYWTVHPKHESFVINLSLSSCSKPVWVSLFCWAQKNVWRMLVTKQPTVTIDFHCMEKNISAYYGNQWLPFGYQHSYSYRFIIT